MINEITKDQAIKRIAEIDAMFAESIGWGSWMAEMSGDRKNLADKFGLEHKWIFQYGQRAAG